MAFGKREKETHPEQKTSQAATSPTRAETFLDAGSVLSGELRFEGDVRFEGQVEGQIRAGKSVVVGESAEIDATIEADTLEVYGTVVGDIRVLRQTTLHKTARVEGEIHTAGIVVEEGARFKGCIVIGPDEKTVSPARTPSDLPDLASAAPPNETPTKAKTD